MREERRPNNALEPTFWQKEGAVEVVYEDKLDPNTLANAIARVSEDPAKTSLKIDLQGAEKTAKILSQMI